MSLDNENGGTQDQGSVKFDVVTKKQRTSYSREFLLSLSNLDICKKLPSGFDESLLSEFQDASQSSIPERPRISGGVPLHGFRRNDYSSSPPTRGDYNNNSRGIYGKWESRSSGRSDRDSDSQSDKDSDSGKRYVPQSRRSWQTPEHDGLLGSGSFPRPSGYAAGVSAPKVRTSEQYQLSKSNEPYHPPRPYKAVPYSKRDTDSFNDETFGSLECTSEDRAEEERRRRASFEMMRKEQQKALQEKNKLHLEKRKAGVVLDHSEVLEESKEKEALFFKSDESEVSVATAISSNDPSFSSHSPVTRPLIPPGFRNSMLEKSSGSKSSIHPPSEVGKSETGGNPLESEANIVQTGIGDGLEGPLSQETSMLNVQLAEKTQPVPLLNKGETVTSQSILHAPIRKLSVEEKLPPSTNHLDLHGILSAPEIVEFNAGVLEEKSVGDSNRGYSTSILTKIFGSTLTMNNGGSGSTEHHDGKPDDTSSPSSVQSSKFAQWFVEEEAKAADDVSFGTPNDIMSLIVSGDKGRNQVSDAEAAGHLRQDFTLKTLEQGNKITPDRPSASDSVCKEDVSPAILTCEDLEQSILSEYSAKTKRPLSRSRSTSTAEPEQPSACVDDHASLHLLSLLQKGSDQTNMIPNSDGTSLSDKLLVSEEYDMGTAVDQPKAEENNKNILSSGKSLTLETLFGSAFMQELQSVQAPVSVQRGSNGSVHVDVPEPRGLPFPVSGNDIASPMINGIGLQRPSNDYGISASNSRQQTKLSKAESWLGLDNSLIEMPLQKHHTEAVPKSVGFERTGDFQLPEEESLISVGNPRNHRMSTFMPTGNTSSNVNLYSNAPLDIKEKLSALSGVVKEEHDIVGSGSFPFTQGPYEQLEPEMPYRNLQMQQSPQFPSPQMTQVRPLYHQLEPHPTRLSSQMDFLGPEPMFNRGSRANPELSRNIIRPPFHQPKVGVTGFDVPAHNSMLHQMQMPGNRLPQILPDFARTGPVSHHGNQPSGLVQEMNQMQGFPLGPRQPNIGSHGMPIPGPHINSGGNPPEAFQRLIEMELRANSKQIHPTFTPGHNQGLFGHEVDMSFRYR